MILRLRQTIQNHYIYHLIHWLSKIAFIIYCCDLVQTLAIMGLIVIGCGTSLPAFVDNFISKLIFLEILVNFYLIIELQLTRDFAIKSVVNLTLTYSLIAIYEVRLWEDLIVGWISCIQMSMNFIVIHMIINPFIHFNSIKAFIKLNSFLNIYLNIQFVKYIEEKLS